MVFPTNFKLHSQTQNNEHLMKMLEKIKLLVQRKSISKSKKKQNALNNFREMESQRYNGLMQTMRNTWEELFKALNSEIVMSYELEKVYNSLICNKVPYIWLKIGYYS